MVLIIGGAYQGKTAYAKERFGFGDDDIFDLSNGCPDRPCSCLRRLECFTKSEYQKGSSVEEIVEKLRAFGTEAVILSREVGSGVVPIDPEARAWRELHGRVLQLLAGEADSVIRIFCTIPEVLK